MYVRPNKGTIGTPVEGNTGGARRSEGGEDADRTAEDDGDGVHDGTNKINGE